MPMEQKKYNCWFTLVELIITITILAILATLSVVWYRWYVSEAKNASMVQDMKQIEMWLYTLLESNKILPEPENSLVISVGSGNIVWYQWFFGTSAMRVISLSKNSFLSADGNNYTYLINKKKTSFQLLGFQSPSPLSYASDTTYAQDYDFSQAIFQTAGNDMWILAINSGAQINKPLHYLYDTATFTGIDLLAYTGEIMAIKSPSNIVYNSGSLMQNAIGKLSWLAQDYDGNISLVMTNCWKWAPSIDYGKSSWIWLWSTISGKFFDACTFKKQWFYLPEWTQLLLPSCPVGWLNSSDSVTSGWQGMIWCQSWVSCQHCVVPFWWTDLTGIEYISPSCSLSSIYSTWYEIQSWNPFLSFKHLNTNPTAYSKAVVCKK